MSVDSTLFGSARGRALRKGGRQTLAQPVPQNPIVISRAELERMRTSTIIRSEEQLRAEKEAARAAKEQKMRAAKERRERMEAREVQRKAALPKNKSERRRIAQQKKYANRASLLMQEQEDDVKTMNAMMQYSLTVGIRDAQLKEKTLYARKKQLEEQRAGILMEIARIRQVKKYIDRENRVRNKAREDRKHIERQIKERAAQKVRDREAKRREQLKMKERMAELEREEEEINAKKRADAKVLLKDILDDNERAIAHRKKMRELDIAEDLAIHKYQLELQEKQRALEAEKERMAKERTLKIAKMRAKQKKAQDGREALDALRAKRAAEEHERRARARDLKEAEDKARAIAELQQFRRMQQMAKEMAVADARKRDEDEFYRNQETRKNQLKAVRKKQKQQQARQDSHKASLIASIKEREAQKKQQRENFVKLGIAAEAEKEAHLAHLNSIKTNKIEQLRQNGVPEKYLSELGNFDPRKVLLADYKRGL